MARKNTTLQLCGSSFTLFELEAFVHDARDMGLPVDGVVVVSHQSQDRQGGYDYTLSTTGSVEARPARPKPLRGERPPF